MSDSPKGLDLGIFGCLVFGFLDFWMFEFLDYWMFGCLVFWIFGFILYFFVLLILFKVTMVTTEHKTRQKVNKNCIKSLGQSPLQELEEGQRSGPYLLVTLMSN